MSSGLLEVCCGSYASTVAAQAGGADRIELCANLVIGGTTPSQALFRLARQVFDGKINVLIRPRFGDFLYEPAEMDEICDTIRAFRDLGADGVVFGALTPDGELDLDKMERMIRCADGIHVTLHRAFDMARDPFQTLEDAIGLGCGAILTSGQAHNVSAGAALLAQLQPVAEGRIDLMAGSGVKSGNIRHLHEVTGITHYHATARTGIQDSGMVYRKETVSMGLPGISEYEIWHTDPAEVRACAQIVHSFA